MTWKKLTENDCHDWELMTVEPQVRYIWRSSLRSAMYADSQLPGRCPIDMSDAY